MKKRNIYQNQSQELLSLFEQAANNAKVMCVPIDYAKKDHVVMFCNGYGDILRKPFSVKNSPAVFGGATKKHSSVTYLMVEKLPQWELST